ncbi:hypothetical protein CHS0354_013487 [Potamilus streckersoni]|uniref:Uncharacterized protein n=1 Tax=Potamilus streckersoni TaxID=2493646 RepID=A0AAE0T8D9_9BIVA|nr:hypothetical protein CHS0354_013487 [Potamilus streckersoni]
MSKCNTEECPNGIFKGNMKISRSCYSNLSCWSVIIFVLVSLVEPWTSLECGNTSSTRISSPNTDGGYIVDIHHHLFDPQIDLIPSQNYTISLHSGNVDSSIAGIMVTVESEAGTDAGRIVSTDNCTLNLPLTFIWTVPNSDSSCLYVR